MMVEWYNTIFRPLPSFLYHLQLLWRPGNDAAMVGLTLPETDRAPSQPPLCLPWPCALLLSSSTGQQCWDTYPVL